MVARRVQTASRHCVISAETFSAEAPQNCPSNALLECARTTLNCSDHYQGRTASRAGANRGSRTVERRLRKAPDWLLMGLPWLVESQGNSEGTLRED